MVNEGHHFDSNYVETPTFKNNLVRETLPDVIDFEQEFLEAQSYS